MKEWNVSEKAAALHQDALVWDMTLPWTSETEPDKPGTLDRFNRSGFNFVSLTMAIDIHFREETMATIAKERAKILSEPDKYVLVETVEDILRAKREDKLALGLHFQGTNPVQHDLRMVEVYYRLGIRHMLLAYNQKNSVGDGCHERTDAGLSRFGISLIQEMNRVGMLVDCTHTGHKTTMEAMEVSKSPCIFSHSVCRNLHDHERNIWDDQIKACAKTGGVIGVNGIGFFLTQDNDASVGQMVRHIDHIAELVGVQHIGIGLDFVFFDEHMVRLWHTNPNMYPKGYPPPPWQYFPPEGLPRLTEALLAKGYSEADVRGILGENFLRVAKAVWK